MHRDEKIIQDMGQELVMLAGLVFPLKKQFDL
jgi:hypothetical protein